MVTADKKQSNPIARKQRNRSSSSCTQLTFEQLECRQLLTSTPGLPWLETAQLIDPNDFDADDSAGLEVAISGDTVVFGSDGDDGAGVDAGAVYVFIQDDAGTPTDLADDTWVQQAKLIANDTTSQDGFGNAVDIQGDTLVVGAGGGNGGEGAAYVFQRNGTTWSEVAKLAASDGATGDKFGKVAIDGDTIVVGATQSEPTGSKSGAAYLFVRPQGGWAGNLTEATKLLPDDAAPGDRLGRHVAVSGDTVLVGADQLNSSSNGKVYVYRRTLPTDWSQTAILTASDGAIGDQFGNRIALAGDRAIITAHRDDHSGVVDAGSAYVFERDANGTWTETAKLTASDPGTSDEFGRGVGIDGDTIAVGAWSGEIEIANSGSVYFYESHLGGSWTELGKVTAGDANPNEAFGSLDLQGDELVVGNFARDQNRGSVVFFTKGDSSIIASDLFESGSFSEGLGQWSAGAWTASGDARIRTDADPHSGTYHARLRRSSGDLRRVVDVSGLTDLRLRFWSKLNSFEGSDQAHVQVSGNGSSWTTLTTFANGQDDNEYHFFELDVPDVGNTLHIRFDAAMNGSGDYWYIDNVEVAGVSNGQPNQAPSIVSTPVTGATEDVAYSYDVDASDPDVGDTLTYSLGEAPSGMSIDSGTGLIAWSPDNDDVGTNSVTVRVHDAGGLSDTQNFDVTVANVNDAPVAQFDIYAATRDEMLSISAPGVLQNDSDIDGDTIFTVPWSGVSSQGGQIVLDSDGSFDYTPPVGFEGTDTFAYTASDGSLSSAPATVSIEVSEASTHKVFVYDIRFDSFWSYGRAVFEIRSDSNFDGIGSAADAPASGVAIEVEFAGRNYSGTTDASGVFRSGWLRNPGSGSHAEVVDLALAGFVWIPLELDLEDDSDGDGKPDVIF